MPRPDILPDADPRGAFTALGADAREAQSAFGLFWETGLAQVAQFQATWLRDTAEATAKAQACGSLADLAAVVQAWAMARAKAYGDAGFGLATATILPVEAAAAHPGVFQLPD